MTVSEFRICKLPVIVRFKFYTANGEVAGFSFETLATCKIRINSLNYFRVEILSMPNIGPTDKGYLLYPRFQNFADSRLPALDDYSIDFFLRTTTLGFV
jgi:hypothetical protein